MSRILIIDDDLASRILVENLRYRGFEAERIATFGEAMERLSSIREYDLVVLDLIMPLPAETEIDAQINPSHPGMEIYLSLRKLDREMKILVFSAATDAEVARIIAADPNATFVSKWESPQIVELVKIISKMLGVPCETRAFIVHGHNEKRKYELKNFLQNTLALPEPIVLHEQASLGRTIIEKFEDYAMATTLVFVLLTPDDKCSSVSDSQADKYRARQNVIYEMGYFTGLFGRRSGKVILLHEGAIDLPSDILGVLYIDITLGIEACGEKIRKEIAHFIC